MADTLRFSKRIVKLVISVSFWWWMCLSRFVLRLFGREVPASCVILYYHSVPAEHQQWFAWQMDTLARVTLPISIDDSPLLMSGYRYSAVTFDDAFENIFDSALPELLKRSIPAAIFVPVDLLGQRAEWWPVGTRERQERICTAERLKELPSNGVIIGSHTLTHPRLPMLTTCEAKRELATSKEKLEHLVNRKIRTFSFPYGAFDGTLVSLCQNAGYERVFTTLPVMAFREPSELVIGRVGVEPTDWAIEFYLKLVGAYQWLPYAFAIKRGLLRRNTATALRQRQTKS
jgi:peptidoglycan/xylan/chitin deacetylase (PgdA/CDA1 family)